MTNPFEQIEAGRVEGKVPVKFITGQAGTGKTYGIRQAIAEDPSYAVLAATTGIAAVNLGAITLNSLLKYFNTQSLEHAFYEGWLLKVVMSIFNNDEREDYRWLAIDEGSMLDGAQLDIIYTVFKQMNEFRALSGKPPVGIILIGDFCQLPPIKAKWAFEADCWPEFEAATERLTKVWRQEDATFLEAINHIRSGRGMAGATMLARMGVEFHKHHETSFQGTTIIAKNEAVDNFNFLCHSKLAGVPVFVNSSRWMVAGRQHPKEWDNIPAELKLKRGAYVMILNNDTPNFTYVNGDCGYVEDYAEEDGSGCFAIKLVRTGETVFIDKITRYVTQKEPPDELLIKHPDKGEDELRKKDPVLGEPYWDSTQGRSGAWVVGSVKFFPLRLAYASTVHKTQGLTLDRVQIDLHQNFMSAPAMVYVALSRCKSPKGLRIIGTPALLGARTKVEPAVVRWL